MTTTISKHIFKNPNRARGKTVARSSPVQWRFLLSLLQALPLSDLAQDGLKQLPTVRRWSTPGRWLLVMTGATVLLYWHGRLVLATGVGIGVMTLIYLLHDWQFSLPGAKWRQLLQDLNQPLTLAIAGGGIATLTTYLAASIWIDSDSPWIAIGALLQGTGTIAVLLLLLAQMLNRSASRDRTAFSQMLADLTHDDPLRRLIAVRQLINSVSDQRDQAAQRREGLDYLRLMLSRESEPIIRDAVLDGLQRLDRTQPLSPAMQPLLKPVLKRSTVKSRQRLPLR